MQPMAMAPPTMQRKGGVALGIGIALLVLGVLVGVVGGYVGYQALQDRIDGMERASLPQGGTITLEDTGTYKVFVERPTTSGGGTANVAIIAPDGSNLAIQSSPESEDYDIGGRHGKLLGTIEAPVAGDYELQIPSGTFNGGGQFAVAKEGPEGALVGFGGAIFGGIVLVVIGIILIIVGAVRRSRSKRPPTGGYPQGGWGQAPSGAPAPGGWAPPPSPGAFPPAGQGTFPPANPGGFPSASPGAFPPAGPAAPPPPPSGPSWNPPQTGEGTSWNPPPPS